MLELMLSLVDRLIQLVATKENSNEEQFYEVVKNTFVGLERIHEDYLKMFEGAKRALESGEPVDKIIVDLTERPLTYELLWRRLERLSEATANNERLTHLEEFSNKANVYLASAVGSYSSHSSALNGILHSMDLRANTVEGRETAVAFIDNWLVFIHDAWNAVSGEYAALLKARVV